MEKNQYKLCLLVLHRLASQGILNNIILVGSWCLLFYKEYFSGVYFSPSIRTRDVDFLVPIPSKIKNTVDVPKLLKDLGFVVEFVGSKGYIQLSHPELIIEFLVPERGRGSDKPYALPQISLNAQPLRYLDFLVDNAIEISVDGMRIKLPHPVAYALHKLIIIGRRTKKEKAEKDQEQALRLLHFVIKHDKPDKIKAVFNSMPKKWQKNIKDVLIKLKEEKILDLLV